MALTRSFREGVMEELRNKEYRRAFLVEIVRGMLEGDFATSKAMLRDYINGTVGFIAAGEALGRSPKSLMRMLSSTGNPQASNLLELVAYLQRADGVTLEVKVVKARTTRAKAA